MTREYIDPGQFGAVAKTEARQPNGYADLDELGKIHYTVVPFGNDQYTVAAGDHAHTEYVASGAHDKALHDSLGIDAATLGGQTLAQIDAAYLSPAEADAVYVRQSLHDKALHDALGIDAATLGGATLGEVQLRSERGQPNGYATLDAQGKILLTETNPTAITKVSVVASEAEQLALAAEEGDVAVRSDLNQTFMHNGGTDGTMAEWTLLATPTDAVLSVDGRVGAVTLSDLYAPVAHVGTRDGHPVATTTQDGFQAGTDKAKLDGIGAGAQPTYLAPQALADPPENYPTGVSIMFVASSNGWPADGYVLTIKTNNTAIYQRLFQSTGSFVYRRYWVANAWNTFINASRTALSIEGVSNPPGDINLVPGAGVASITGDDTANTITFVNAAPISTQAFNFPGNASVRDSDPFPVIGAQVARRVSVMARTAGAGGTGVTIVLRRTTVGEVTTTLATLTLAGGSAAVAAADVNTALANGERLTAGITGLGGATTPPVGITLAVELERSW